MDGTVSTTPNGDHTRGHGGQPSGHFDVANSRARRRGMPLMFAAGSRGYKSYSTRDFHMSGTEVANSPAYG